MRLILKAILRPLTLRIPIIPALDYGPCGSDYRNVENIVLILKSNFHLSRINSLIVNGWEFAPFAHILSGAPFTVTSGSGPFVYGCWFGSSQPDSRSCRCICISPARLQPGSGETGRT